MRSLIALADNDPRTALYVSKPQTKMLIKELFLAKFHQAILDLEAEHPFLHLCSYHWKAEAMISQAFLWRGDDEVQEVTDHVCTTSLNLNTFNTNVKVSQPPKPLRNTPTTHVQDVPPMNVAKYAYEASPRPKSPSASHVQKHSKDSTRPSVQKATDPLVLSKCSICQISK
jgi:hypothetical protein